MNAPERLSAVAQAAHMTASPRPESDFDRLMQRTFTPMDLLEDNNFDKLWKMAESLANSALSVPKELKGNIGDCLAIVTQAMIWGLNPFAVAQKAHVINGKLGYEAQLVNAVVMQSGAIRGSFHYEYRGNDECRVGAVLRGETEITWGEWLSAATVTTKNSPLWKTNPKQQLGYLQVKNWVRAFAPGAVLGIYTADELADGGIDPATGEVLTGAPTPAPAPAARAELPAYAMADFQKNFPAWQKAVAAGKKSAADVLVTLLTKATLTDAQKAAVLALKPAPAAEAPAPAPAPAPAEEPSATDAWVDDMNAAEGAAQ